MKKNGMKKLAVFLLALLMTALCLTACGGSKLTLTIADGNTKTEVEVGSGTKVSDILKAAGITLGDKDTCVPDLNAEITDSSIKITVNRYTEPAATEAPTAAEEVKEEKVTEKIAYSTREEYSSALYEGEREVTRKGVEGEREITYKVTYADGKETAREKISEKVIKEPVDEIVTIGTGSDNDGYDGSDESGRTEVSRVPYYDCDGSGHGYWEITYDDGSVEYEEF